MRTETAKITSKGQITIPIAIREALSVAPGDRVSFLLEDGIIRVERERSWAERTAGMFKGRRRGPPPTIEELRDEAEIAIVEDVMRRMGD